MSERTLTCGLCGHRFDPTQQASCSACPVSQGCNVVCCPVCGYSDVDPNQSVLAKWIQSRLSKKRHEESSS